MVVSVKPIVVKQDMHLCRSDKLHELAEARIEAELRRYAFRRDRAPNRTRFLGSQGQSFRFGVSLPCNLVQPGLWKRHGRRPEGGCARHQIVSIVWEGEELLVVKARDGDRELERDGGLHVKLGMLND
jgi:hypothetical protein